MLEVKNLNKYYNKGKRNEIHVINDTSLAFPKTGLITLFGPSGCGKTTLLNVIGGLDDASGDIIVDNEKINIEKYRRENIGYIFQSYNLINDLTVYENLSLALSVNNIENKEEVDKRIVYALKAVGMFKYRKKLASELSGGQQQRVSIARALVKKCKIIIADEPTGNLDSTNSIQIMNILKSLSKTKLVLLVTHSSELANYYSDKIIEITDGKVLTIKDSSKDVNLTKKNENKVYLGELEKTEAKYQNIEIDCYQETKEDVKISLVFVNGTYYLKSNVKIVPYDNQVEIVEGTYEESKDKVVEEEFVYSDDDFNDTKSINIFSRIKNSILEAFSKRLSVKRKRIFKLLFFILGFVLVVLNVSLARASFVETKDLLSTNDDLVVVENRFSYLSNETADQIYIKGVSEKYIPALSSIINVTVEQGSYYSKDYYINALYTQGLDLASSNLIYGDKSGALITSKLANKIMKEANINDYTALFRAINYKKSYSKFDNTYSYLYSGIVEENSDMIYEPTFGYYTDELGLYNNEKDTKLYSLTETAKFDSIYNYDQNKNDLLYGRLPENNGEIIVSSLFFKEIGISETTNLDNYSLYTSKKLSCKIVGVFSEDNSYLTYTTNNDYRFIVTNNSFENFGGSVNLYSLFSGAILLENSDNLATYSESQGIKTVTYYDYYYNIRKSESKSNTISNLQNVLICALILVIYIFFIMRTQIIRDVYEVGVLRALGLPKIRLYLKYVCQIVVTMLQTVLVSYLVMNTIVGLIMLKVSSYTQSSFNLFLSPSTYYVFFIVLVSAIIIGLIPVMLLVHKKPAQILAKYDM